MLQKLKTILIICAVVTLAWFLWQTDWPQVVAALRKIGWKFFLLILTTGLASVFGSWAWQFCLADEAGKISLNKLFVIRHLGETVSILNPTGVVGGEAFKVALLKKHQIDQQTVLSSIFISRILTMLTQVIVFVVVVLILYHVQISNYILNNRLISVSVICGLVVLNVVFKKINFDSSWFKISFKNEWILKILNELTIQKNLFIKAFQYKKKAIFLASICLIIHWCLGGFEFYLILRFLEVPVSVLESIFIDMGVMYFKVIGSIIPGQVGIEEYGNKVTLQIIGAYSASVWVAASILRRSRQLFWIVVGFVMYKFYRQ